MDIEYSNESKRIWDLKDIIDIENDIVKGKNIQSNNSYTSIYIKNTDIQGYIEYIKEKYQLLINIYNIVRNGVTMNSNNAVYTSNNIQDYITFLEVLKSAKACGKSYEELIETFKNRR